MKKHYLIHACIDAVGRKSILKNYTLHAFDKEKALEKASDTFYNQTGTHPTAVWGREVANAYVA